MEKLTLEHIAPYLPYGLMVIRISKCERTYINPGPYKLIGADNLNAGYLHGASFSIENSKPILRSMDLTKPITIEGKEVIPIVELAKIMWGDKIEIGNFRKTDNYQVCEINPNTMHVLRHLIFDSDGFHHSAPRHREPVLNQIRTCPNQRELWKWLYANKFDVDGLIDAGLAIDVNTLETNPYE